MSSLVIRKILSSQGVLKRLPQLAVIPVRNLNLLEYQSKELLRDNGISIQNFAIVDD